MEGKFVGYYRVSTQRQGASGLGLEAQQAAVRSYLNGGPWELIEEVTEIESGRKSNRPQLARALHLCKVTGSTLVIAKLDRLARNVHFLSGLMEAGVEFVACDMPQATRLTVHILAAVAEAEAKAISDRTKAALQAAKARGIKLGNPNGAAALRRASAGNRDGVQAIVAQADMFAEDVAPVVAWIQEREGIRSLSGIAAALTARHIKTPRGGRWHATSVKNLLARLVEPTA
jgi:DNA invertase Pin-like site-specific DNA recombinase